MENKKYTQKIYLSLIAYESSVILGSLAKLYLSAGVLNKDDSDVIKEIFGKIKGDHVKTANLKKVAKAIKVCIHKELEINYENLETVQEFKSVFKDKNSFLNTIQNQQIPTVDDLKVYSKSLDVSSSNTPIIDIVLSNKDLVKDNPEFEDFLSGIKDITESIKKAAEQDEFKSGAEVMDDYEEIERRRLAGEGFYTCGYQSVDKYLVEGFAPKQVTIIAARPAMGKCLGKGTKVRMYSGELKKVEDIVTGELLMGPDSKPRTVLGTTKGFGMMYTVNQNIGINYSVNGDHILSLIDCGNLHRVFNISVIDYLKLEPENQREYLGYKSRIDKSFDRNIIKEYTEIEVIEDKEDDYFGFELDGDHLFLLEDMTVTHNSALAVGMMRNLSKQGVPTAQFVLEMDNISYMDRFISMDGMIDLEMLIKYPENLTESENKVKDQIKDSVRKNKHLYLRDKPSPSIKDIKEKIIKLQERIGQKYVVVFIDLFDKIKNVSSKSDNMQGSFHISLNDIQVLAKELEVHFVLVAQINRESEKTQTKRPGLQNLKHSGAFEEVADIIIFIDRPSYRILEEEIAEIESATQPAKYVDGFDYESLDNFIKRYDSEIFENIGGGDKDMDTALQESISSNSIKDDKSNLDSKLKESSMVKVGNIVIPVKEYAEIIIAKQRRGSANKIIPFIFKGQYSLFTSVNLVSPFSSGDRSM